MKHVELIVREIIENKISEIVNYEIEGNEFVNRVIDQLPINDETDVFSDNTNVKVLDKELFDKFVDHLTEISMSRLKVN
jgi:hypothetical protein